MLFNSIGQGDFLAVHALSTPTVDLPATVAGPLTLAAPALAVYATRTASQLAVFVLSRKMDNYTAPQEPGYTPLTLRLPLRSAQTVTLYAMTGDARLTNLDADLVRINQTAIAPGLFNRDFRLDQLRGVSSAGLPPGATMVYVFGGAVFDPPGPPTPTVVLHGPMDPRLSRSDQRHLVELRADLPCSPCGKRVCPLGHHDCMRLLTVDDVGAAMLSLVHVGAARGRVA